jgi:hypothetical protein
VSGTEGAKTKDTRERRIQKAIAELSDADTGKKGK